MTSNGIFVLFQYEIHFFENTVFLKKEKFATKWVYTLCIYVKPIVRNRLTVKFEFLKGQFEIPVVINFLKLLIVRYMPVGKITKKTV